MPILSFLAGLATLTAGDLLWLGVLARSFYVQQAGELMRSPPHWPAAVGFYLLYTAGVYVFAVVPKVQAGSGATALHGALLGLLVYGVYDLTNLAILKNWPPLLSAVDIAWGTVLTAAVALAMHLTLTRF